MDSENFHQDFMSETKRIIIHGVLHLCGFDDETDSDKFLFFTKLDAEIKLKDIINKRIRVANAIVKKETDLRKSINSNIRKLKK